MDWRRPFRGKVSMTSLSRTAAVAPRLRSEQFLPGYNGLRPPLLAASARAGAGESCTGFSVEDIHLVLIQTLGAAELDSLLAGAKVQILLGVADVLAPVAHLRRGGQRLWRGHYTGHVSMLIKRAVNTYPLFEHKRRYTVSKPCNRRT